MASFVARGGLWVAAQVVLFVAYVAALRIRATPPAWVGALGLVLALAGVALAVVGLLALGRNLTPYPQPLDRGGLVDHGIYARVRHPIYGGLVVAAVGWALAAGSLPGVAVALGLLGFFRIKAGHEEGRLVAAYPEYADYQGRVPKMLIPWVV